MVRRDHWTGRYRWMGLLLEQGPMQAQVYDIYIRASQSPPDTFLVLGATSSENLGYMLDRLNLGKTSVSARLERFLQGVLDEETVKKLEAAIIEKDKLGEYTHTFTPGLADDEGWVLEIMRAAADKFFKAEAEKPPEPTTGTKAPLPDPTTEEKPIKSVRWPKEVRRRLEFMRYLRKRGVFNDDLSMEA